MVVPRIHESYHLLNKIDERMQLPISNTPVSWKVPDKLIRNSKKSQIVGSAGGVKLGTRQLRLKR
jgi:hypothetical protein